MTVVGHFDFLKRASEAMAKIYFFKRVDCISIYIIKNARTCVSRLAQTPCLEKSKNIVDTTTITGE